MMRYTRYLSLVAMVLAFTSAAGQTPAADPSAKLREVLPADVAERVLAKIAEARARELPAAALENRALKFAARGVPARDIEKSVEEQTERMEKAKNAIEKGRARKARGEEKARGQEKVRDEEKVRGEEKARGEEIEAGAEAMRKGVDGAQVSELAKSAPSGRSLAVPLFVIGGLIDRGLPSDAALERVQEKLRARATDREIEQLPGSVARRPEKGRDRAEAVRPGRPEQPTVKPPATVPRNPGTSPARPQPVTGAPKRP